MEIMDGRGDIHFYQISPMGTMQIVKEFRKTSQGFDVTDKQGNFQARIEKKDGNTWIWKRDDGKEFQRTFRLPIGPDEWIVASTDKGRSYLLKELKTQGRVFRPNKLTSISESKQK